MIVVALEPAVKRQVARMHATTSDAVVRRRAGILLDLADGFGPTATARRQRVARTTVHAAADRWRREGFAGLFDGRAGNGRLLGGEGYLDELAAAVAGSPQDHGWPRPTWTQELLVLAMERRTGVRVSRSTMARRLAAIGARLGRPKPVVGCPWPAAARERRLDEIRRLPATLPPEDRAFHADEVDVHLNPKVGPDWMLPGQQKLVVTPGQNEKRYAAGALDLATRKLTCEYADRKTSVVFVLLLWRLFRDQGPKGRVHVVLDNYGIHKSKMVAAALEAFGGRVVLHFLPPYCPDANRIERVWQDMHANVTRNHRCRSMDELMGQVQDWVERKNAGAATRSGKTCDPTRRQQSSAQGNRAT